MRRWRIALALLGFAGAAIVYASVLAGQDPDWFSFADLMDPLGLHHEVLFVGGLIVGTVAVVA